MVFMLWREKGSPTFSRFAAKVKIIQKTLLKRKPGQKLEEFAVKIVAICI